MKGIGEESTQKASALCDDGLSQGGGTGGREVSRSQGDGLEVGLMTVRVADGLCWSWRGDVWSRQSL